MHASTHALLLAEQEQTARAEVVLLRSELAVESRAAARARGGMPGKFVRGQETLTLERNTVATLELRSRVNEEHALEETVTQLREDAALHRKALSAALADSSMRAPRQQRSPLASWLKSPWQKGALLFRAALPRSHRISAPRSRFDCTW
jgi:hypothetical protein